MDPSYNSGSGSNAGGQPGGSNMPGAKPGVIASGPDTEDMPTTPISIPTASEESSRSKISSLLGKRKPSVGASTSGSVVSPMGPRPMQLSGNSGKSKKTIIFLGLAVVAILIVVLVVGMALSKGGNGGNNKNTDGTSVASPTTVREQFNAFYHYLTENNPKDIKDITVEDLTRTSFYIDSTDLTSAQRDNFLKAFNDEMTKFIEAYSGTGGEQPLDNIYAYVYVLHKLDGITVSELRDIYNSEGATAARKRLADMYQNYNSDNSNSLLDAYIILEQEYLTAFIDSLETGDGSGVADKQSAAMQAKYDLRLAAHDDLEYLYSEVYDKNLNEGAAV